MVTGETEAGVLPSHSSFRFLDFLAVIFMFYLCVFAVLGAAFLAAVVFTDAVFLLGVTLFGGSYAEEIEGEMSRFADALVRGGCDA